MGKGCDDTICVDKPINSILHPNVASMGLYKSIEVEKIFPERPLYRSEFGPMTWKVLHRIGVMFPDNPNKEEKIIFKKMINGLSTHFPCKECSEHFKEEITKVPPKTENKIEISKWICYQHNQVNKRLGKEIYDCENFKNLYSEYKL